MALTASTLIDDAVRQTFGYANDDDISEAQLLAELSRQDEQIVNTIAQINPDALSTEASSVSVTDAKNSSGYTLQAAVHYRDFVHADPDDDVWTPINVLQKKDRDTSPAPPAGFLEMGASDQGTFYPVDPLGKRWTESDDRTWFEPTENHEIVYSYVPAPSRVTQLSDTLQSPDLARTVITYSLELSILLSLPPGRVPEARLQSALQKRQGAFDNLRMQFYKLSHPRGNPPRGSERSEQDWVQDQVT